MFLNKIHVFMNLFSIERGQIKGMATLHPKNVQKMTKLHSDWLKFRACAPAANHSTFWTNFGRILDSVASPLA